MIFFFYNKEENHLDFSTKDKIKQLNCSTFLKRIVLQLYTFSFTFWPFTSMDSKNFYMSEVLNIKLVYFRNTVQISSQYPVYYLLDQFIKLQKYLRFVIFNSKVTKLILIFLGILFGEHSVLFYSWTEFYVMFFYSQVLNQVWNH